VSAQPQGDKRVMRTGKPPRILDAHHEREQREVVQEREHRLDARVREDDCEPHLAARQHPCAATGGAAHQREERVVREHGREQEREQREQDRPEQALVKRVVPAIDAVPEHVGALACARVSGPPCACRCARAHRGRGSTASAPCAAAARTRTCTRGTRRTGARSRARARPPRARGGA
jgi:hypothetical protein